MTISFNGIASKREYAYTLVITLALDILLSVVLGLAVPNLIVNSSLGLETLSVANILPYVPSLIIGVVQFLVVARRLRGLGQNPWLALILGIPLIGYIFAIALIFGPESEDYGDENDGMPGLGKAGMIDQSVIDAELRRQAAEANVVDTHAKDIGDSNKK